MADLSANQQLLETQLESIASQGKKVKQMKPVDVPKSAGIRYNAQLQKLVAAIREDINTQIMPLIKSLEPQYVADGWATDIASVFNRLLSKWRSPAFMNAASETAAAFVKTVNEQNQRRFSRNAKSIGIDVFGDNIKLQNLLEASALDNSRLITTIPEQYLNQVQSIVMTNMKAGLLPRNIASQLREQFGVTKRRAALIARDQTSKINGEISKSRQEGAGFEYFKWLTSQDSRVRDRHESIAKADVGYGPGIYRWDDPPKDEKGNKIIPGSPINCRCVAVPVIKPKAS